jgi:hypothetical protein
MRSERTDALVNGALNSMGAWGILEFISVSYPL